MWHLFRKNTTYQVPVLIKWETGYTENYYCLGTDSDDALQDMRYRAKVLSWYYNKETDSYFLSRIVEFKLDWENKEILK